MRSSPVLDAVRRALGVPGAVREGDRLVVALSGGADSVALLDSLRVEAPRRGVLLVAAHLDHGLRPDSGAQAEFCGRLCAEWGVSARLASADVRARAGREGEGLEAAARRERYAFLSRVRADEDARAIVLGHTRDDQAETVLLRLLRGAGARGLGAMSPSRDGLLRPLLGVSRTDVLAHLKWRGLAWYEDPSNSDLSLRRNRVRHELLPYLEAHFNPRLRESLARAAEALRDEADLVRRLGDELYGSAVRRDAGAIVLSGRVLAEAHRAVRRAALRRALEQAGGLAGVSSRHVESLARLVTRRASSPRPLALPGGREAVFRFGDVRIGPSRAAATAFEVPLEVPGTASLPGGLRVAAAPDPGPAAAGGSAAVVLAPPGPLSVRNRRPGDRIRSGGRVVSLRRFLAERKVPADERTRMPVVASGGRVLWVPGQAADQGGEPSTAQRFVRLELTRVS